MAMTAAAPTSMATPADPLCRPSSELEPLFHQLVFESKVHASLYGAIFALLSRSFRQWQRVCNEAELSDALHAARARLEEALEARKLMESSVGIDVQHDAQVASHSGALQAFRFARQEFLRETAVPTPVDAQKERTSLSPTSAVNTPSRPTGGETPASGSPWRTSEEVEQLRSECDELRRRMDEAGERVRRQEESARQQADEAARNEAAAVRRAEEAAAREAAAVQHGQAWEGALRTVLGALDPDSNVRRGHPPGALPIGAGDEESAAVTSRCLTMIGDWASEMVRLKECWQHEAQQASTARGDASLADSRALKVGARLQQVEERLVAAESAVQGRVAAVNEATERARTLEAKLSVREDELASLSEAHAAARLEVDSLRGRVMLSERALQLCRGAMGDGAASPRAAPGATKAEATVEVEAVSRAEAAEVSDVEAAKVEVEAAKVEVEEAEAEVEGVEVEAAKVGVEEAEVEVDEAEEVAGAVVTGRAEMPQQADGFDVSASVESASPDVTSASADAGRVADGSGVLAIARAVAARTVAAAVPMAPHPLFGPEEEWILTYDDAGADTECALGPSALHASLSCPTPHSVEGDSVTRILERAEAGSQTPPSPEAAERLEAGSQTPPSPEAAERVEAGSQTPPSPEAAERLEAGSQTPPSPEVAERVEAGSQTPPSPEAAERVEAGSQTRPSPEAAERVESGSQTPPSPEAAERVEAGSQTRPSPEAAERVESGSQTPPSPEAAERVEAGSQTPPDGHTAASSTPATRTQLSAAICVDADRSVAPATVADRSVAPATVAHDVPFSAQEGAILPCPCVPPLMVSRGLLTSVGALNISLPASTRCGTQCPGPSIAPCWLTLSVGASARRRTTLGATSTARGAAGVPRGTPHNARDAACRAAHASTTAGTPSYRLTLERGAGHRHTPCPPSGEPSTALAVLAGLVLECSCEQATHRPQALPPAHSHERDGLHAAACAATWRPEQCAPSGRLNHSPRRCAPPRAAPSRATPSRAESSRS